MADEDVQAHGGSEPLPTDDVSAPLAAPVELPGTAAGAHLAQPVYGAHAAPLAEVDVPQGISGAHVAEDSSALVDDSAQPSDATHVPDLEPVPAGEGLHAVPYAESASRGDLTDLIVGADVADVADVSQLKEPHPLMGPQQEVDDLRPEPSERQSAWGRLLVIAAVVAVLVPLVLLLLSSDADDTNLSQRSLTAPLGAVGLSAWPAPGSGSGSLNPTR